MRRFGFAHEALVARSALEAFGIPAWVRDETNELAVRARDAQAAREILAGDHSADLDALPEAHLPPARDELCPRCGRADPTLVPRPVAASPLLRLFARWRGHVRRCRGCAFEWRV